MQLTQFETDYSEQKIPFYKALAQGQTVDFNGRTMLREEYNLIISKRDFGIYAHGMKPNRYWSFNATKKYYGLTGNKYIVTSKMNDLFNRYKEFASVHVEYV